MKVYILLTVLAMTALAVVPAILWKHKTKASWKSYFIGFVIFMLFARILEPLLHMVCLIIDSPVSRLINHSAILYGLYGGLAAGLFEETGRYTAFRWILKNQKRPADAVMYGWGHGGIEILTIIVPVLILALLPNPDPAVQAALPDMTIAYLASALFERILAVSIHVCLSVWVWKAVHQKKIIWFAVAILMHALIDFPVGLYQKGLLPQVSMMIWLVMITLVLVIYTIQLYKKMDRS
ncbi:MAG: YhfC family intramembrane metalloprotease [Erysipelotrichaceae bacterium]|nr:YhfC family intramembrane metalloprotease [Erysipelotrichaceae bacterium]